MRNTKNFILNLFANRVLLMGCLVSGMGILTNPNAVYANATSVNYPEVLSEQSVKVSGVVVDEQGISLPGVNVVVKGSSHGTITDFDGMFNLEVMPESILTFSYIGYNTKEIKIQKAQSLKVTLKENTKDLEEVIVVGYGTQRKSDLTGSVVSVKADDVNAVPTSNIAEMLRGQAAGLQVTTGSSRPGGSSSITIRGNRSLTGGNSPLFVVDGVPVNNIDDLNAADIKSIEVLKDASAQSIYGARAANGVILVTTQRGAEGKTQVNFNAYLAVQTLTRNFDLYSGQELAQLRREAGRASNNEEYQDDESLFTADMLDALNNNRFTNWEDLMLSNALQQKYDVSVRSGTKTNKFAASFGYFGQDGMVETSGYQRGTFRVNVDQQLYKNLTVGANVNYVYSKKTQEDGTFNSFITMNPLAPAYDNNGGLLSQTGDNQWNPLWNIRNSCDETFSERFMMNVFADWSIYKGLSYRLNTSLNSRNSERGRYQGRQHEKGKQYLGLASLEDNTQREYLIENIFNYKLDINAANRFDATFVQSVNQIDSKQKIMSGSGFSGDDLKYNQLGSASNVSSNTREMNRRTLLSYMGRVRYYLMDRYLFSASMRVDGSSVFGKNNKYGYFPSASFAWRMNEESFLKEYDQLSNLKLRVSYGAVGNQGIDPYQSQGLVDSYYMQFGEGSPVIGYLPGSQLWNPDLKWETTYSLNTGVDFGFFRNRLSGTLEYYNTQTHDLLMKKKLNQTTGYSSQLVNVGRVENQGFELTLSGQPIITKDFSWSLDGSFSLNRNKIKELTGDKDENGKPVNDLSNNWFVGSSMDVYYDYVFDGIWQLGDDIQNSHMPDAKPGDVKVKDLDQNGELTDADRTIIKKDPKFIASFGTTLKYKGFDLAADFYWVEGVTKRNPYLYEYNSGAGLNGKLNGMKVDYWTPENPSNVAPRPRETGMTYFQVLGYQDASYFRLRNLIVGYTLPKAITQKFRVENFRVYASCTNLFTITDFKSYSPELSAGGYPEPRTFTFGLNLTF